MFIGVGSVDMRGFYKNLICFHRGLALIALLVFLPQASQAAPCRENVSRASWKHHERAFTMTELMVSVAIIGTLVGILLPSLASARNSARNVKCLSNLRQALVATQVYENAYKVLPVHSINNNTPNPTASVNLRTALEIDEGTIKAWQCPEDKGFYEPQSGETYFHSYLYLGLSAMLSQQPPFVFYAPNAQKRYEKEVNKHLYYRLPVYTDVYGFHQSRQGPPYYLDGKRNAAYWDGTVTRVPDQPPPPPTP